MTTVLQSDSDLMISADTQKIRTVLASEATKPLLSLKLEGRSSLKYFVTLKSASSYRVRHLLPGLRFNQTCLSLRYFILLV